MKKKPEQTNQTRQRIIDAFWTLYKECPIERISVKEVIKKAGFHRSTFYEYFDNVYEILAFIENDLLKKFEDSLDEMPPDPNSDEIIRHQIKIFGQYGEDLFVLASDYGDPSFGQKVEKLFARKREATGPTNLSNEQLSYLVQYTSSGFTSVISKWMREGQRLPVDDLIKITHVFKDLELRIINGTLPLHLSGNSSSD